MTPNNFADQAAVEVIRSALWRESGSRAAIMVGAGFSRNAEPKSASTREMPSWAQMANSLCAKLYPVDSNTKTSALQDAMSTSGFLRLAQEYKVAFGQGPLNEQIRALVPDNEYEPGKLHKMLLNLPWTDIHTTNWDTLLERGALETFDIDYDVVRTFSEIPTSKRPRIVKLHGSFPAHEPFIFTEEDYRTYPRSHAPFVNLVQQSLMESVLCLIGFSGDDPNFLHWTGWVRDNLGVHAPKIYLVGCLSLSNHRRRMLEDRNVVPVDLSGLLGFEIWPEGKRHFYATEWFLRSLSIRAQYDQKTWPERPQENRAWPTHLPPPIFPTELLPEVEPMAPEIMHMSGVNEGSVIKVANIWKKNRDIYPGWMIAPLAVRDRLWKATFSWIRPISSEIDRLSPTEYLFVLDQLIWRLETCLSPHFVNVMESAKITLGRIDILARKIHAPDGVSQNEGIDWSETVKAWIRVSIWVAIDARCSGDFEAASVTLQSAKQFALDYDDLHNSIEFEQCLILRDQAKHEELISALSRWSIKGGDSAWHIRKCGLLAGVGLNEEVKSCLESALHQTRKYRRRDYLDHAAYSREAWLLWLSASLKFPQSVLSGDTDYDESVQRLRRLGDYECNVLDEFEQLVEKLNHAVQHPHSDTSEKTDFFGRRSQSMHFINGMDERVKRAYEVIRLADATGFPSSISIVKMLSEGLRVASKVIISDEGWMGLLWTIRASSAASDNDMEMLSQTRIALLAPKHIELGHTYVIAEIKTALGSTQQQYRQHWKHRLPAAIEIHARLLSRARDTDYENEIALLCDLLKNDRCIADHNTHHPISTLLINLFKVVPKSKLIEKMPSLFALPINSIERLPEPADFWPGNGGRSPSPYTRSNHDWTETLQFLIGQSESSDVRIRATALRRIMIAHRIGYLDDALQAKVANVVWKSNFCDDAGWPLGDLYPWAYFSLPEPKQEHRLKIFRKKFLAETVELNDFSLKIIGTSSWVAKENNLSLVFNRQELKRLKYAFSEWAKRKVKTPEIGLSAILSQGSGPDLTALHGLTFLVEVLKLDSQLATQIWDKLEILENQDTFVVMQIYPLLLLSLPDRYADVENKIRTAINSTDSSICTAACQALLAWCDLTQAHKQAPRPSVDLIVELGRMISSVRRPIIISALELTAQITLRGPAWARDALAIGTHDGLLALFKKPPYPQELEDELDIPRMRQAISRVVAAIKATYHNAPSIFDEWYQVLSEDPLQEVRLALQFDTYAD